MNTLDRFFGFLNAKKKKVDPKRINFGWRKDLSDPRDIRYKVTVPHELPPSVDLRSGCPDIYDQGELGSCTANALGAAYQFEDMKQGHPDFIPSRLFVYYNEREIEGTINEDAGAQIRDGIKTMVDKGVCPESMWPYYIDKFKKKPDNGCYTVALENQIKEYLRLSPHSLYEVRHCLAEVHPVTFGFTIFESMMRPEVAKTGIVTIPGPNEAPMGGHAVLAVGYDDEKRCVLVRNSWGKSWGMDGYFWLPYWFIETPNVAADFWTIRLVE